MIPQSFLNWAITQIYFIKYFKITLTSLKMWTRKYADISAMVSLYQFHLLIHSTTFDLLIWSSATHLAGSYYFHFFYHALKLQILTECYTVINFNALDKYIFMQTRPSPLPCIAFPKYYFSNNKSIFAISEHNWKIFLIFNVLEMVNFLTH